MKKTSTAFLLSILLGNLAFTGCSNAQNNNAVAPESQGTTEQSLQPAVQTPTTLSDILNAQPAFADASKYYTPSNIAPNIKESESDPTLAKNFKDIQKALNIKFSSAQLNFLKQNKFLIIDDFKNVDTFLNNFGGQICAGQSASTPPCPPDYMTGIFSSLGGSDVESQRLPVNAVYVNSDIILHTYHVFFDRYLKRLEENDLQPLLVSIIDPLQKAALADLKTEQNTAAAASLQRVAAYLTLGKILLETNAGARPSSYYESEEAAAPWIQLDANIDKTPDAAIKSLESYKNSFDATTYQNLQSEIKLIYSAQSVQTSPLFGVYDPSKSTDYTQFTPRSHYTEDSLIRSYFRAMMLFGRQSFPFGSKEGLEDSSVLTSLINETGAENNWTKFSDATDFIAGASDDITYKQFKNAFEQAVGTTSTLDGIFDPNNYEKIRAAAAALPDPKILSEIVTNPNMSNMSKEDLLLQTKGLRLFGQKFTFDAWILNQMSSGDENTVPHLPSTPTALFVAAVLGSQKVQELLPAWIKQSGDSKLDANQLWTKLMSMKTDLSQMSTQQWLGNTSSAWLWTLSPLLQQYGKGYPAFMQSAMYVYKNLQTVLGSYTELKHDTLLYAKQSYAELGAGGPPDVPPPPVPKGFVEPDMEFWARMIAFSQFTEDGLNSHGLLENDIKGRLDEFITNLKFYQSIAQEELTNAPISDDDYEQLRTNFYNVSGLIMPFDGEEIQEKDKKPDIIADIATDAKKAQILYEATGNPLLMLTFVSDQGTPRITIGVTYRQFEFTGPLGGNRLTDDDWRTKVDNNDLPQTPFYYQDLFVK